jgi:putative membrane protein
MTKSSYTILCRGIVATGVLATTVALQAQQNSVDQPKHATAASGYTAKANANDPAACLTEAAKMNTAVIQVSQLAAQKAQSDELKRFAKQLEADHKQAQSKLETIAQKHNVTLPTSLDAKCEEEITKLKSLSGNEFDKEFARGAVEGHAMALAHLQQASSSTQPADIAQYTQDMLAHVKAHQQQARNVAKDVGLDQATIAALEKKAQTDVGSAGATTESSTGASSNHKDSQERPSSGKDK